MTIRQSKVLIVDDEADFVQACKGLLEAQGYRVAGETTAKSGQTLAIQEDFDVVVTDLHLAGRSDLGGFNLIRAVHAAKPNLPIILVTGDDSTKYAIEATRIGAFDYIRKGHDDFPQEMIKLIEEAITASRLVPEPEKDDGEPPDDEIVGMSNVMQAVYRDIGLYAVTPVTVLIQGETGTGKEVVACALHNHSARANKRFIAVNCAAIPEPLLEDHLFGHEPGAFADARRLHKGYFEEAHQGTLFLDEIGDMTLSTQVKLLRVLQEKVIRRLGGEVDIPVDVRVIAATHHDLQRDCRERKFRDDLYFRLNVAVIRLPPLRERKEDIPRLVRFFIQRHALKLGMTTPSIISDAILSLLNEPWPGNVRELENVVCKALLRSRGHPITVETIRDALGKSSLPPPPAPTNTLATYIDELLDRAKRGELKNVAAAFTWDLERELYARTFERAKGNQSKTAEWLGVTRATVRAKLKHYSLLPDNGRESE